MKSESGSSSKGSVIDRGSRLIEMIEMNKCSGQNETTKEIRMERNRMFEIQRKRINDGRNKLEESGKQEFEMQRKRMNNGRYKLEESRKLEQDQIRKNRMQRKRMNNGRYKLEESGKLEQDQIRKNSGKGHDGARKRKARARSSSTAIVMLTMMWIALANNIGMTVNGFVVNNGIGYRIRRKKVLKSKLKMEGLNNESIPYCKTFAEEVEAGDEKTAWNLVSDRRLPTGNYIQVRGGQDEKRVSFECEKSADCESVAGRVSVFTDATVTQSVVNGGCHESFSGVTRTQAVVNGGCYESCSGVRSDEVCRIGNGTGDTDATIARSDMSGGCNKMSWRVDDADDADIARGVDDADDGNIARVVDTEDGTAADKNNHKAKYGLSDADRLDKARTKYCMKGDADGMKMACGEYNHRSDRLTKWSADQSGYQARSDGIIVGAYMYEYHGDSAVEHWNQDGSLDGGNSRCGRESYIDITGDIDVDTAGIRTGIEIMHTGTDDGIESKNGTHYVSDTSIGIREVCQNNESATIKNEMVQALYEMVNMSRVEECDADLGKQVLGGKVEQLSNCARNEVNPNVDPRSLARACCSNVVDGMRSIYYKLREEMSVVGMTNTWE